MSLRSNLPRTYSSSRLIDTFMRGLMVVATLIALVPLVLILGYVAVRGGQALSVSFFTETYRPPLAVNDSSLGGADISQATAPAGDTTAPTAAAGTSDGGVASPDATADPFAGVDVGALAGGNTSATAIGSTSGAPTGGTANSGVATASTGAPQGGVLHGIIGTLLVTGLALLIALPIGILAGVFLSEFPSNSVATVVRFACDVLSGAPSIVIGVVGYVLIVQRFNAFSGLAGSIALMFLMVPTITRTTEEILKLVPQSTREAALAMGAPMWYSTFTVVIPAAAAGIATGVLLAFARGAGETAPLILTVLGNNELSYDLLKPIAALPLMTYRYTESPFPAENTLAWGTALVLVVLVLSVNVTVRLATRNRMGGR